MLAYLCVIYNPRDDVRLLRIINNPPRGLGGTTVGRLADIAAETNRPVYDVIADSHKYEELKSSAGRLHLFADMIDEIRECSATVPLDELYEILISRSGYIRMLEEKGSDENLARIENVRELKTNIIRFMNESGGSLFEFLSETALFTDLDRDDNNADRVHMMTMHSAKGLEFDSVFIVGAEEGIFPGIRSIGEPDEIEEERRLCYVAMTRAMRRLYFTSAQNRMLFGKTASAQPSRFLNEIHYNNIEIFKPRHRYQNFDFGGSGSDPFEKEDDWAYCSTPSPSPPSRSTASSGPSTPSASHSSFTSSAPSGQPSPSASSVKLKSQVRPSGSNSTPELKINLRKGDSIEHRVFGRGVVTDVSPVGGDSLLEIAFDEEGTKRMLLNSVSRYIKKVETV
jgi:DNA helicase-2/ATP-dependent DNA helicase PcrA